MFFDALILTGTRNWCVGRAKEPLLFILVKNVILLLLTYYWFNLNSRHFENVYSELYVSGDIFFQQSLCYCLIVGLCLLYIGYIKHKMVLKAVYEHEHKQNA